MRESWQGICSGWEAAKALTDIMEGRERETERERRKPGPVSQKEVSITKGGKKHRDVSERVSVSNTKPSHFRKRVI